VQQTTEGVWDLSGSTSFIVGESIYNFNSSMDTPMLMIYFESPLLGKCMVKNITVTRKVNVVNVFTFYLPQI